MNGKPARFWQLFGLLSDDELAIKIPEWLAEEKVGFADRVTPLMFVGRIGRETEKAILSDDSVTTRPLMSLVHLIHALEVGLSNTAEDDDWEELVSHRDEWIPKSPVRIALRREVNETNRS